uniref:dipeptidase n=1 Tax=Acetatifactor sp. TaxID=1872090 RepID=UPI00405625AA
MKIIDMHCDTISSLFQKREAGQDTGLLKNDGHLDLQRMQESGYLLQNFALFVNLQTCRDPWEMVCRLHKVYQEELEKNIDIIAPVLRYEDIGINTAAGKMSALLTVEEGAVCKGNMDKLHELHKMGVRMFTLTWNFPNELGYPNLDRTRSRENFEDFFYTPNTTGGLTEKGMEFVTEMERLGMIPDVSHMSDAGFYDVLATTQKPFVASHSNARSICRCVRNLSDDMIRKLAERGGCMGLNFYADFLKEVKVGEKNPGAISDVVRHALHITKVGGVDVLGLGSDFDGIDTNEGLPGVQSMGLLWEALQKAGYRESELDKIFFGNVLRVYQDTL